VRSLGPHPYSLTWAGCGVRVAIDRLAVYASAPSEESACRVRGLLTRLNNGMNRRDTFVCIAQGGRNQA
jgi:hypothetical protein